MRGAGGAARHLAHRSDGETDHGRAGDNARLQNGIEVIDSVPVGRYVLLRQRENNGELACGDFKNRKEILAHAQNPAVSHGGRDGDAAVVDDAVSFRRIDGDDGVHGGINLMRIAFSTCDG